MFIQHGKVKIEENVGEGKSQDSQVSKEVYHCNGITIDLHGWLATCAKAG